ncbi:eukaryotic initiation factor 4A-6 [Medicago truncatula]|uniref:eukaryotic initiation factor 4A-6 n=1 Tax=Medicago truncatula TaxID=3880 RepID=UPI000D2F285C|nr:eukaryotic initiation factor 4A-6 [Medicago truncatula]
MLETFCIGILKKLDYGLVHCQALVLAPTMELVLQIKEVMQDLGRFHGVKIHACVGGTSVPKEDRQRFLKVGGVHIIVGTPRCVYDMLQRGRTRLDCIKMFVMDEVDQMLSLGFKDKIDEIFKLLPCKIQVGVISATMPPEALEITRKFMKKPVTIQAKPDELTLEGIKQFYVDVEKEEWKLETLCDIFELTVKAKSITHCIVFVDTRCKVDWLTDKMQSRDHKVSVIQSDMDQNTRDIIVREFFSQSGSPHVLITTDPLVCGTDVHKVSLIVNYDLPAAPENYLYRIGRRSGQFGRCVAINFMTKDEATMIIDIQKFYNMVIEELPYNFDELL